LNILYPISAWRPSRVAQGETLRDPTALQQGQDHLFDFWRCQRGEEHLKLKEHAWHIWNPCANPSVSLGLHILSQRTGKSCNL